MAELATKADVLALKGVRVVANSLVWAEGYPVDGSSALSRYFDDKPFRAALWFQSKAFKEANKRSTALRREFYIAEKQQS